ncbi:MAG: aspartyl-phosphate phosphatase Spo0E family protein [Thermoflavifilum sp.]|nr:aspartyl-phosphate phosphatase Spo0E family protein [Thermoflavifilum sp.]MCL6515063.1 aspartyl-phosphate phosphatase Spo0E family protein [Alicyclobacillus sp.]
MEALLDALERARAELYTTVEACGGELSHPAVIAASQRLDRAIVRYMSQRGRAALRVIAHRKTSTATREDLAPCPELERYAPQTAMAYPDTSTYLWLSSPSC